MSSGNKRRFFDRNASPVVASDDDFDAVFGSVTQQSGSTAQDIPIERIRMNPFQARTKFKDIDDLAGSMRTHGFTTRLRVRRDPSQPQFFQLVYGERRLRAAHIAGIKVVPCDVTEYSDQQMREIGLTENLQRSDLEPLEEARAFRIAIDDGGYSIRTLASQIGKSKGYVQSRLDLLRAPDDVQQMVDEHPETFTAGLLIGQLPTPELRQPLIKSVISGDLDKEAIREIVRDTTAAATMFVGGNTPVQAGYEAHGDDNVTGLSQGEATGGANVDPGSGVRRRREVAAGEQNRASRQSQRALAQATHVLRAMTTQLKHALPEMKATERDALLDFIVQEHFPELEEIVQLLRSAKQ